MEVTSLPDGPTQARHMAGVAVRQGLLQALVRFWRPRRLLPWPRLRVLRLGLLEQRWLGQWQQLGPWLAQ